MDVIERLKKQGELARREDGMIDRWYYTHEGQTLGPVTAEQLRQLAASGLLIANDLIWPEGRQQSEGKPAQASIDFPATTVPVGRKPDWLDGLRTAAKAEHKPANPAKPDLRAAPKVEQKPAGPAKSNWLDDVSAAEREERDKDRKQRASSTAERAGSRERLVNVGPVKAEQASAGYKVPKLVLRSKATMSVALLLFLAIIVAIPLIAWDAVQRERANTADMENERLQTQAIEGYVRKAAIAAQRGRWREAVANYDQALDAGHPDSVGVHLRKARAFQALNDEDNFQRELIVLASLPNLGEHESSVLLLRGESLLGRDDVQGERLIRQALEKRTLPPGEDDYARALLVDATPKAVDLLREALARDAYQPHARGSLELLLILLARFDEARAELKTHAVLFPEDRDAKVLQALLLAAEAKPAEAQKALDGVRGKLPESDIAAMRELTAFLAEIRNPVHRPDPILGLPDLSLHWLAVKPALRRLWPGLAGFAPDGGYRLFSRLPLRLRKYLEAVPEMLTMAAESLGNVKKVSEQAVVNMARAVETHPEGTLIYVRALMLWNADQWQEADQTALRAVETPALVSIRRPALFVAAASKANLYSVVEKDAVMSLRAVESLFVPFGPAFFASSLAEVAAAQLLLSPAIGHLHEMLALGDCHPLIPEFVVRIAIMAGEYNLARQLLDDWKRESDAKASLVILGLRAETELKAKAYTVAWEAAEEYLRRKPDDAVMRQWQEDAKKELVEQMRRFMPAAPGDKAP